MVWQFCGPFLFLLAIPALHAWSPLAPCLAALLVLVVLVIAELQPAPPELAEPEGPDRMFRLLVLLYVPLQLAMTAWATYAATRPEVSAGAFASLVVALGIISGVFGMLAAHELIHSHKPIEAALGVIMLTAMTYRHFRIAHIHGHHRWAGTDRDPGTARLGESFYAFLARTVPGQIAQAWRFEQRRAAGKPRPWLANRMHDDLVAYALLYGAVYGLFGAWGAVFVAAQSALAILLLELFNYIAHYGLMRGWRPNGTPEPMTDRHSWNTSNAFANRLIFNMGRHSDHHRRATAHYQTLQPIEQAPELPAGYAGSIVLALIPPLWRRVMDPQVRRVLAEGRGTQMA